MKRTTLLGFVALTLGASAGYAACSNPSGNTGEQFFNTTHSVMQYCNGSDWVNMGGINLPASDGAWAISGSTINYTDGNVGIGTASPAQALHVLGEIRSDNNGNPEFVADGAPPDHRFFRAATNGAARWDWGANATAESGSNAGSDFFINRFDDNGAYIDTPLLINRSDSAVTMSGLLYAQGGINTDKGTGGYLRLMHGDATHNGYVEFWKQGASQRSGYIGWGASDIRWSAEGSNNITLAPEGGTVTVEGNLSVTGSMTSCSHKVCTGGDWVNCSCNTGETLTGGGCRATSALFYFQSSRPTSTTNWECGGQGGNKEVSIICCNF